MSGGGGSASLGSEGVKGSAHRVRRDVLELSVLVVGEGAHRGDGDSSPELSSASGTCCRRRRRRYGTRGRKRKTRLASYASHGHACIKRRARGGVWSHR